MIPRVGGEEISRAEIEELLDLAVRAPNHHRTEPWRFYVLTGRGRDVLAAAMSDEAVQAGADAERAGQEARAKVERAPVIVVFTSAVSQDPKVVAQEDVASVAMAIENFLLGAHAMGLGAMLRTGTTAYHPALKERLGLGETETVVGLVYLGRPAAGREPTERAPASSKTTWVDRADR